MRGTVWVAACGLLAASCGEDLHDVLARASQQGGDPAPVSSSGDGVASSSPPDAGAATGGPTALAMLEPGARVNDLALASDKLIVAGGVKSRDEGGNTTFAGFVRAIPVSGGNAVDLWSGNEDARSLAVADGRVTVATFDGASRSAFVRTLDLTSGSNAVVTYWNTATGCTGVAATPTTILWTSELGGSGTVSRANWDGTDVQTLADGESCPGRAAVMGSSLVWLSGQGIESIPLSSGSDAPAALAAPADILPSEAVALSVQPGSNTAYVASGTTVYTVTLAPTATAVFDAPSNVAALTTDAGSIFVATTSGTIIRRTTGGAVTTLVSGLDSPTALAADGHAVYWADHDGIARVPY